MVGRIELWEQIKACIDSADICLYDIDMPAGATGVLRVYLARKEGPVSGVGLDDCARASRLISANPDFDTLLHTCSLEVSSPGVNRRLRRDEHFLGAVGERVSVTARLESGETKCFIGSLEQCADGVLTVVDEEESERIELPISAVQKANVEFNF